MLMNPILASKATYVKIKRRFGLSFWCAAYNVWLVCMMILSVAGAAITYLLSQIFQDAKGRMVEAKAWKRVSAAAHFRLRRNQP